MNISAGTLLLSLALLPSKTMAGAQSDRTLKMVVQELRSSDFPGTANISALPAPADLPPIAALASESAADDHTKEVLEKFPPEILKNSPENALSGGVARKLGFAPSPSHPWNADGDMVTKAMGVRKQSTGEQKTFAVTNTRGKIEIIIAYMKDDVEVRAYLVSSEGGVLKAAIQTPKGTAEIPSDEAAKQLAVELAFWVRYYDKTH
jgi:hypothetical protein